MKEPAPPMPGTYLALWIGVMCAIAAAQYFRAESAAGAGILIGMMIPFAAVGWALAKATWPSYWRQKYRPK